MPSGLAKKIVVAEVQVQLKLSLLKLVKVCALCHSSIASKGILKATVSSCHGPESRKWGKYHILELASDSCHPLVDSSQTGSRAVCDEFQLSLRAVFWGREDTSVCSVLLGAGSASGVTVANRVWVGCHLNDFMTSQCCLH